MHGLWPGVKVHPFVPYVDHAGAPEVPRWSDSRTGYLKMEACVGGSSAAKLDKQPNKHAANQRPNQSGDAAVDRVACSQAALGLQMGHGRLQHGRPAQGVSHPRWRNVDAGGCSWGYGDLQQCRSLASGSLHCSLRCFACGHPPPGLFYVCWQAGTAAWMTTNVS
jgi:hypothetical protein